jgi:ATP-dependent RNA helicase SUPV3L1/SUV3
VETDAPSSATETTAEPAPASTADEAAAAPALTPDAEPVAEPAGEDIPAAPAQAEGTLPDNSFAQPPSEGGTSLPAEQELQKVEGGAGEAASTSSSMTAAEPEMIEIWRPGRPAGLRNRRDAGKRRRRPNERQAPQQAQPADGQAVAAAPENQAAAGEAAPAAAPDGERKPRHGRPRHRRDRDRADRQDGDQARPQRADRQNRQDFKRERQERPPRGERPPRRDRDRDDNRPSRTWSSANERRGKDPDPNSPFAKLLALKEQLEANKER